MPAIEVEHAYRRCEDITRREAANFFYGIRLLPPPKRQAMSAVYAFARRVDDIGDDGLERTAALEALANQRRLVSELACGQPGDPADPVSVALAHAVRVYDLPVVALGSLIEGVQQDVLGTRFETFDELVAYCRQVAGSIGRLCLAIFGSRPTGAAESGQPDAPGLADDLGVAMQLTNILRDIREDALRGRVYLPTEDLRRFGAEELKDLSPERAGQLIRFEAHRAVLWFDRGLVLVEQLDRRSAACVLAMAGIYRGILERISLEPTSALQHRVSLPTWEKAWVAGRSITVGQAPDRQMAEAYG